MQFASKGILRSLPPSLSPLLSSFLSSRRLCVSAFDQILLTRTVGDVSYFPPTFRHAPSFVLRT
jgi:hypothetical protein